MRAIALTGGGTAGHVVPALALIPDLKRHFDKIIFIGGDGIEGQLAKKAGLEFYEVPTIKLDRTHPLNNVKIPIILPKGIKTAKKILAKNEIKVVFSKGGFASLPACFAAKSLKIPIVAHESDFSLGLANKIVSKFAFSTLTSFKETSGGKYVGNPVRREILSGNRAFAMKKYDLDPSKPTLLVFGGSLGAEKINEVIYKGLKKFTEKYNVLHISGKSGDMSVKAKGYRQFTFSDDMPDLYAASDYVVCRAGANALSEVACLGKRCVAIPLPKGNSRGDQEENAMSYKKGGHLEVLSQQDLYVETLFATLETLKDKKPPVLDVRHINAAVVEEILKALANNA